MAVALRSVGPAINETIYDGGRRARRPSKRAAYDETVAAYRQTVLNSPGGRGSLAASASSRARRGPGARRRCGAPLGRSPGSIQAGIASYLNVVVVNAAALPGRARRGHIDGRLVASVLLIRVSAAAGTRTTFRACSGA
jgi:hypothetical protein